MIELHTVLPWGYGGLCDGCQKAFPPGGLSIVKMQLQTPEKLLCRACTAEAKKAIQPPEGLCNETPDFTLVPLQAAGFVASRIGPGSAGGRHSQASARS